MTREELGAIERYWHKNWIKNPPGDILLRATDDFPALIAEIKRLKAEEERLTRERDAAVKDMKEACVLTHVPCAYCQHRYLPWEEERRVCSGEDGFPCWEWRGVQT